METTTGFGVGRVVITTGASLALQSAGQGPAEFLRRHEACDWGDVCAEDWQANDDAIVERSRVLSAYRTRGGDRLWIITEAGYHTTTILLPEEY